MQNTEKFNFLHHTIEKKCLSIFHIKGTSRNCFCFVKNRLQRHLLTKRKNRRYQSKEIRKLSTFQTICLIMLRGNDIFFAQFVYSDLDTHTRKKGLGDTKSNCNSFLKNKNIINEFSPDTNGIMLR